MVLSFFLLVVIIICGRVLVEGNESEMVGGYIYIYIYWCTMCACAYVFIPVMLTLYDAILQQSRRDLEWCAWNPQDCFRELLCRFRVGPPRQ